MLCNCYFTKTEHHTFHPEAEGVWKQNLPWTTIGLHINNCNMAGSGELVERFQVGMASSVGWRVPNNSTW